jgi:hypothetical protein
MIPIHIDSDQRESCGSRIRSGTGSKKIFSDDFGYAENEMMMWDGFDSPLKGRIMWKLRMSLI